MTGHRVRAERQPISNRAVRHPLTYEFDYLDLSFGQTRSPCPSGESALREISDRT